MALLRDLKQDVDVGTALEVLALEPFVEDVKDGEHRS
jgi:hypothetical protein